MHYPHHIHHHPRRDGRIRYEDFLRVVEEDRDLPYKGNSKSPNREGGANAAGRTTERERLAATCRRAVARGIDYRREMELEHGASSATGGVPGEDGVISCQR